MVVVGLVGVLVALLLPALRGARQSAFAVSCAANLRELYVAQTQYAAENRGRYAGVAQSAEERWERRLERYLVKGSAEPSRLMHCPAAVIPDAAGQVSSYGLNPCIMMSNWRMRRDARMDSSRIILMGDKPAQLDDYLTTNDGWYLLQPQETGWWYRSEGHSSRSQLRHSRIQRANLLMADGHVEALSANELLRDGGRWYWGEHDLPEIVLNYGPCCP